MCVPKNCTETNVNCDNKSCAPQIISSPLPSCDSTEYYNSTTQKCECLPILVKQGNRCCAK